MVTETATQTSPWIAFQSRSFTVLWGAGVISSIGTWMYSAASGWLMTELNSDPLTVSLVQVASTLPNFLFALPAGALTDIVDKRQFLIIAQIATTIVAAVFAGLVWLGLVTPASLLVFTFLIGAGSAFSMPAWQAIVPLLVPKAHLARAVAANSVGLNVSRAVGPAAGGAITAAFGIAAPFWINAASNFGVIGGLFWWHTKPRSHYQLPAERFFASIRAGLRYGRNNPPLRTAMIRAIAFFFFASAYWALLPLVARQQIAGGPELYGILLGSIGVGAVSCAFVLPSLEKLLGPDRLVITGTIGTVVILVLLALARDPITAIIAGLLAGGSWIAVLATLNVSAQLALPDWVRGRGLALYATVFFGAMTLGSAIWGKIAGLFGLPAAHLVAAAGALAMILLTKRWRLETAAGIDLAPSMHWPTPVIANEIADDQGPVLVTIEYRIDPTKRESFLTALHELSRERRRDGAYAWGLFEDAASPGRLIETFYVDSWLEHLRQHERVTNADRILQDAVAQFNLEGAPAVSHFVAAEHR